MNFFKNLFGPNDDKPKENTRPASADKREEVPNPAKEEKRRIANLIDQLSYIHQDATKQLAKRTAAYEELASLEDKASSAIPALIRKRFDKNRTEQGLAEETLDAINLDWPATSEAQECLTFLFKKLKKDRAIAKKASMILKRMGDQATEQLIQLAFQGERDVYIEWSVYKMVLASNNPELVDQILPHLKAHFKQSENTELLEVLASILIANPDLITEQIVSQSIEKLNQTPSAELKCKLVRLISVRQESAETTIPALFNLMMDEDETVRATSVESLSFFNSNTLNDLSIEVIHQGGVLTEDFFINTVKNFGFWNADGNGLYVERKEYYNNWHWHFKELDDSLQKPKILLNSVLDLYKLNGQFPVDQFDALIEIIEKGQHKTLKIKAIQLLATFTYHADAIIPVLVKQIDSSHPEIRAISMEGLSKLEPKWHLRPVATEKIHEMLDAFEARTEHEHILTLVQIGDDITDLLVERLQKTENRLIQENIIKVLNDLGDGLSIDAATLSKLQDSIQNTHSLNALKALIAKLEK